MVPRAYLAGILAVMEEALDEGSREGGTDVRNR